MIKTYKTLPIPVLAVQWNGTEQNLNDIIDLVEDDYSIRITNGSPRALLIESDAELDIIELGDYLTRGLDDEIEICSLRVFEENYILDDEESYF